MALSLDGTTGISASGNIVGNNISVSGTLTAGTFSPSSLSASGNITGGNLVTAGVITATGNITGSFILGNGSQLTGIDATSIQSGTSNVRVVSSGGNVTAGIGGTSNVLVISTTGVFVTGVASASGNITGGNLSVSTGTVSVGNIVNTNANGVGNIGSSSLYYNTVFAKATSAQYADVAEKYVADRPYSPGTVLEIGGPAELQATTTYASTRIAGVVSTTPALLMNSSERDPNAVELALLGRVPCRVTGTVHRGDLLTSSDRPGVATALLAKDYEPGCVIGKALEGHAGAGEATIEVLVGRL